MRLGIRLRRSVRALVCALRHRSSKVESRMGSIIYVACGDCGRALGHRIAPRLKPRYTAYCPTTQSIAVARTRREEFRWRVS